MGVDLAHGLHAGVVGRLLQEADAQPRRQADGARHDDHRRREVVTEALLPVEQEVIDDIDLDRRRRQVERVGVLVQERLDGSRLRIGRRGRSVAQSGGLVGQVDHARGQVARQDGVAGQNLRRRILRPRGSQPGRVGWADLGNDGIGVGGEIPAAHPDEVIHAAPQGIDVVAKRDRPADRIARGPLVIDPVNCCFDTSCPTGCRRDRLAGVNWFLSFRRAPPAAAGVDVVADRAPVVGGQRTGRCVGGQTGRGRHDDGRCQARIAVEKEATRQPTPAQRAFVGAGLLHPGEGAFERLLRGHDRLLPLKRLSDSPKVDRRQGQGQRHDAQADAGGVDEQIKAHFGRVVHAVALPLYLTAQVGHISGGGDGQPKEEHGPVERGLAVKGVDGQGQTNQRQAPVGPGQPVAAPGQERADEPAGQSQPQGENDGLGAASATAHGPPPAGDAVAEKGQLPRPEAVQLGRAAAPDGRRRRKFGRQDNRQGRPDHNQHAPGQPGWRAALGQPGGAEKAEEDSPDDDAVPLDPLNGQHRQHQTGQRPQQ